MHPARIRILLHTFSSLMALASIALIATLPAAELDVTAETGTHAPSSLRSLATVAPANDAPSSTPPIELASLQPIWSLSLQRPLYDPPPPPPPAPPKAAPPPPLRLTLAGTVVEPGRSRALLVNAKGAIELAEIDQVIDNARVIRITDDAVELEHHGRNVTLKVPNARPEP